MVDESWEYLFWSLARVSGEERELDLEPAIEHTTLWCMTGKLDLLKGDHSAFTDGAED